MDDALKGFAPRDDGVLPADSLRLTAALSPRLTAGEEFRAAAVVTTRYNQFYRDNNYLVGSESASDTPKPLVIQRRSTDLPTYYSVNINLGQAERRKANLRSMPLLIEVARRSYNEKDRMVAEVMMHLCNDVLMPELERAKRALADRMVYELRPVIVLSWDSTAGPNIRTPRITTSKTSPKHGGGEWLNPKLTESERRGILPNILRRLGVDMKKYTYKALDEYGNPLYDEQPTGMPRIDVFGPMNYLIDPLCGSRGVRAARWLATQRPVDAAEVYERFGGDPAVRARLDAFKGWGTTIAASSDHGAVLASKGYPTEVQQVRSVILTEFFMRPAPNIGLPRGLHAIFITGNYTDGDATLTDAVVISWRPLPFNDIPAVDGVPEIDNENEYYGTNYFTQLAPLQKGYNEMFSRKFEAARSASARMVGVSGVPLNTQDAPLRETVLAESKLRAIVTEAPEARFSPMDFSGQYVLQTNASRDFVEAMSLMTNLSPTAAQNEDFSSQVVRRTMAEATLMQGIRIALGEVLVETAVMALRMIQRFCSVDDIKTMLPRYSVDDIKAFKEADLRANTKIVVKRSSVFLGDPMLRLEFLKFYAQGKEFFEKFVDEGQLRELLNMSDQLGPSLRDQHAERAEAENSLFLAGKKASGPNGIQAMEHDDASVHIPIHQRLFADPGRENLPSGVLMSVAVHIEQHYDREQDKAMKMLKRQLELQAMMPNPPSAQRGTGAGS